MVARAHARAGKIVLRGGKVVMGDCPCPCGGGEGGCEHCTGEFPAEVQLTISGVVGCEGRCDDHNVTLLLPRWTLCGWGAANIFAPPDEDPESPCVVLSNPDGIIGVVDIAILGPGEIEVTIHDGIFGVADAFMTFNGTFSGPCNELNLTLSSPTIDRVGNTTFACPPCFEADVEHEFGWCDWSGASIHIEVL